MKSNNFLTKGQRKPGARGYRRGRPADTDEEHPLSTDTASVR